MTNMSDRTVIIDLVEVLKNNLVATRKPVTPQVPALDGMTPLGFPVAAAPAKPAVKFLKKGIRCEGKYYPCWYSRTTLIDGRVCVTIYARSILKGLPAVLNPENDTDYTTDYFDNDRVRFFEGSAEYQILLPFCS